MVHALREEPGSYARMPEDGAEVIYRIRPSGGGLAAGWERTSVGNLAESHEEEFPTLTPTPSSTSKRTSTRRSTASRGVAVRSSWRGVSSFDSELF
jgi:hypothetical protein